MIETLLQFIQDAIHVVLHLDIYLNGMIQSFGLWTYVILFLIIFCETGLVVTPFLPGDSLLFALGALTSVNNAQLDLTTLFVTLTAAAILGDSTNYIIGSYLGPKVFQSKTSRFLNQKHLQKAQDFYERYGGKTIVIARFVPILRTFAPFVAGIARMRFHRFQAFNIGGGIAWVSIFLMAGHYFGNIPAVKERFHIVIVGIIVVSVLPIVVEWIKEKRKSNAIS